MSTPASNPSDRFRMVSDIAESSMLVLASKFIAIVGPASTEADSDSLLNERRRRYPDASHHCWAYRVGRPGDLLERSSDAGEPSGTAGRPILDALRSSRLENVACVVTRYFGGTKLGTGGLVRAYGEAARAAIQSARVVERTIVQTLHIDFEHERTGMVYRVLEEFGLHLIPGTYDEQAHGDVSVPISRTKELQARLAELVPSGMSVRAGAIAVVK